MIYFDITMMAAQRDTTQNPLPNTFTPAECTLNRSLGRVNIWAMLNDVGPMLVYYILHWR